MSRLASRAAAVFPAGSNGEFNLPPELAIVIRRGLGCELWDDSERHFYDFSLGWGSALVGHARPEVVEAVQRQAPLGSNFAYVTEESLLLAEELVRLSPACDAVRFCASGTEATMYCQRLARAFTGRPAILKFEGAYHGANEVGVTSLFPPRRPTFHDPIRPVRALRRWWPKACWWRSTTWSGPRKSSPRRPIAWRPSSSSRCSGAFRPCRGFWQDCDNCATGIECC